MNTGSIRRFAALGAVTTLFAFGLVAPASAGPELSEAAAKGLRIEQEWEHIIWGYGIGATGLHVADLDGSGHPKVVAGAGIPGFDPDTYWYVLAHGPDGYRQEWTSPPYAAEISALRTADLDGAPGEEILVAAGDEIFTYDGATRRQLRRIETGTSHTIFDLQVADADGDGEPEILLCSFPGLFVFDAATGEEEYRAEDLPCSAVAVGEVDGDPSPEIVLGGRDTPGYVLDGATRALEWTYPLGFASLLRLGDVDGDGLEEIVAGARWSGYITIYDADLRSPAWEIDVDSTVDALQVVDVEGDGRLEIVYGDDQWGGVHAWDPQAREPKWSIYNPEHGVTDVAIGDPDGDGVVEVLWGAGHTSSGPDYLYVASSETLELEWKSQDYRGPFQALEFGDVDHDGRPELFFGSDSSESFYEGGLLFVHDARTKALEHQAQSGGRGVWRIRHADVDRDPREEIFVVTGYQYEGNLIRYDGADYAETWRWTSEEGLYSLEIVDVDGDGRLEAVAGLQTRLYVFDAARGKEEWHSVALGTGRLDRLSLLRVADVDDDPSLEIVVARSDGRLFIFDGVTRAQELQTGELEITALETLDRDGDGTAEILIGTSSGLVAVLDAATGAFVETLGEYDAGIDALALVDLTGDSTPELVLGLGDEVVVYDGRAPSQALWRSGVIGTGVGAEDSLRVADIDEDGKLEILVNIGPMGLKVYQVGGRDELPPGPFLESPELPGFRFKVRITAGDREFAGAQEVDCLAVTLCASGALSGRSELFLRVIGPRPNGFLWVNLVRFTPSRVEVWVEQIASGQVNYYELPALPSQDTQLTGLVDRAAFLPGDNAAARGSVRPRPLGTPGVSALQPAGGLALRLGSSPGAASFTSETFPGYRFSVRIFSNGVEQPVQVEDDCLAETMCVSGALPGRSELFLRVIGPRPNGFLWANLVRFTTSRVEVEIEQLATGERKSYVLDQVPGQSDDLPGRIDRAAFLP